MIYLREPLFFLTPRLWAEEGTRYYSYAYHYSLVGLWYMGIRNVQRGYFALWPNIASTIAANLVSVEYAPLVTTLMAFFIQLIPLWLIIYSDASFWATPLRKVTGVSIYLLTPLSGEIWLNTINSQFYLALVTILILIEPDENGQSKKWSYRLLLGTAGLTGPVSSMLVPVYAVSAWLIKERERLIQTIILGICAIVQSSLLTIYSTSDQSIGMRLMDRRLYLLIFSVWTQSIGLLLGGMDWMRKLASWVIVEYESRNIVIAIVWIGLAILAIILFWWLSVQLLVRERMIFLGSYILVLGLSYVGSLTGNKLDLIIPGNSARYFWIPNIVIGFLLMANIFNPISNKFRVWFCTIMLLIILLRGSMIYRTTLIANRNWPQWRTEVALWRTDPEHKIKIWPPGWEITLKR